MNSNDGGERRDRWARLRFAVVGPLLASPAPAGQLRAELERLAEREWGDSNLYLRRRDSQIVMTVEHRAAPGLNDIEIELADDGHGPALRLRRQVPDKAVAEHPTAEQRIVEVLADAEKPLSQAQIRKRAAARNATVSATLQELIRKGRVERAPKACYRLTGTAVHNAATPQAVIGANGQHEAFPKSFPA